MKTFLAGLVLEGRRCAVIGDDAEVLAKASKLALAGARVEVYECAPAGPVAQALGGLAGVSVQRAPFSLDAPGGPFRVVMLAPGDPARAAALFADCEARGVLFCAIDQPESCSLSNLATAEFGVISMGFASGGQSPGLLRRLRDGLAEGLAEPVGAFSLAMAKLRAETPRGSRREVLDAALRGFEVRVTVTLPSWFRAGGSR